MVISSKSFVGFCSDDAVLNRDTKLSGVLLIEKDLRNAFMTRVGERVMRPDYGCKIWDYFMEPLTDYLREQIVAEGLRICSLDERLEVMGITVTQLDSGLKVEIFLNYRPLGVYDTFTQNFESRQVQ